MNHGREVNVSYGFNKRIFPHPIYTFIHSTFMWFVLEAMVFHPLCHTSKKLSTKSIL
jgi:hypothetical protein